MLVEKLHYLSRGADFVVLSGSLPRKVPTTFYADAVRDLERRDVRVVLDSEGEPLRLGVEAAPFLVSPNQREAEQLVGQELEDDDDFLMALDAIAEMGAAQRPHHARERLLRAPALRTQDEADPRIRAVRRAGVGCRLGRRAARTVPRCDRRRALARRRDPRRGRRGRGLGARGRGGPLRPGLASTLAADIELAELQPVRS